MSEMARDLWEMGMEVRPKSMQNKVVEGQDGFITKEINNYHYRLVNLDDPKNLFLFSSPESGNWVSMEFLERISKNFINPGNAWLLRKEEWEKFLNEKGEMDYTYNERLQGLDKVMAELKRNPDTRQAWLPIFERKDLDGLGGKKRIPCSLGYNFSIREGKLNLTYIQRSADMVAHLGNDIILAHMMQKYVQLELGLENGYLDHFIFSLHSYKKDWETLEKGISKL
jgi:thymidylate synthase